MKIRVKVKKLNLFLIGFYKVCKFVIELCLFIYYDLIKIEC